MPEAFSNDYLTTGTTNIKASSTLINAIECLKNENSYTHLAAPMKAAARLLLDKSTGPSETETLNNVDSLPARTGTPRKVIIFETDGVPYESGGSASASAPTEGTTNLDDSMDMYSNNMHTTFDLVGGSKSYYFNGGQVACQNLVDQAAAAKAAGILVITIAYNLVGQKCDGSDHTYLTPSTQDGTTEANAYNYGRDHTASPVLNILASATTPAASGADIYGNYNNHNNCQLGSDRTAENTDGDYFFCAAGGTEMKSIFATAFGQVATGIRLIQLP